MDVTVSIKLDGVTMWIRVLLHGVASRLSLWVPPPRLLHILVDLIVFFEEIPKIDDLYSFYGITTTWIGPQFPGSKPDSRV